MNRLHWGMRGNWILVLFAWLLCQPVLAFTLPTNFENIEAISDLPDPDGLAFSPDGRMFISERISGKLRVATYDDTTDQWTLSPTSFHVFDTPKNGSGQPQARRSGGLRDIAFDPNFATNGLIYAFYMKHDSGNFHNRVVRIKESTTSPGTSDLTFGTGGEELLLNMPFNATSSSGSHNGGAVEFDNNGFLYITTGDGWEGEFQGDSVQSLSTYTGKVFRINADGTIPNTNPFYTQTTGNYRAIYALGLRNPYSMSLNPDTGSLYINEARGTDKAEIYLLEPGSNYRHEGSGIGTSKTPWANASGAGGELITGGAWMPQAGLGTFPATYNGVYFTALWGGNSTATGQISYIAGPSDTTVTAFETDVGIIGSNNIPVKPVTTRIGPEGDLYYLLTTYTTNSGAVRRVRFTNFETVVTPVFNPAPALYATAQTVTISSATAGSTIYYTTDNSSPSNTSTVYTTPINIAADTVLKAKAYKAGSNPSAIASGIYLIGDHSGNQPPIVDAGMDKTVFVGQNVTLDGSGTTDPDDPSGDFLTGELWTQLAGPTMVTILDASEEIASFTPASVGVYQFNLVVSDGIDTGMDQVTITAIEAPRITGDLSVLYTFLENGGSTITDQSGDATTLDLVIRDPENISWIAGGGIDVNVGTLISGADNKIAAQCKPQHQITLEAWITPENTTQDGPARILSLSTSTTNRNFTLGQEDSRYDTRLRTTSTNNNGVPSLTVPASTVKLELTHVVYTRQTNGEARIYINGIPQVAGTVNGDFSSWDNNYTFTLINEVFNNSGDDRSWLGEMYLAAVYCKALTDSEVLQNFAAGTPPYGSPPPDEDSDGVPDAMDNCPSESNSDQSNIDSDVFGDVCDIDIDNDGVLNAQDIDSTSPFICQDLDVDQCDDCTIGVDGFGALMDNDIANDGLDSEGDGLCDVGDPNDDNDSFDDIIDLCPLDFSIENTPDVCVESEICFPVRTTGTIATICF